MTRRTAILSTLGFTTCCSFGESANGQAKKPKNGTASVKVRTLTVGNIAPLLTYASGGTTYAVHFAAEVPRNVIRYPAIVTFVGKLSKAELSRFSKIMLDTVPRLSDHTYKMVLKSYYVISVDDVKEPFMVTSGHPVKVVKGQTVLMTSGPYTNYDFAATISAPGYTLATWGIKTSDKLVMFLVDGDGTIVWRHDGISAFDVSAFQSIAKRTNEFKYGVPGSLVICKQCVGSKVTRERCGSCNGSGKVRCDECSDGSYVSGNGRRLQCPYCDGTANVNCDRCGVRSSFIPRSSGYIDVTCTMCDGYGGGWWPNGGNKFVR